MLSAIGVVWSIDAIQRRSALEAFEATLAAARPGETLDIRDAFSLPWDRVVIVGPYEPGASANISLGFDHYGEYEGLVEGDSGQFIIFVKDQTVVADLRNWGPTWFDSRIDSFDRASAVFTRSAGGLLLPARGNEGP